MSVPKPSAKNELELRRRAEARLRDGTAPPNRGWTTSGAALACLHELASNQASAADALKFLHELQVYQVELDLQYEQLEQSRAELAEQLGHYVEIYERVAVGLMVIDADGVISEANPRAAALLHVDAEHLRGRRMDSLLMAAGRPAFVSTLAKLDAGAEELSCVVHGEKDGAAGPALRITATRSAMGGAKIVTLTAALPAEPATA